MDTAILPEDADGKDPLPEYLAKAQAAFSDNSSSKRRRKSRVRDIKGPDVNSSLLSA